MMVTSSLLILSVTTVGMDTGLQSLASAEHPTVGAEMIQRRCHRSGFFRSVRDAHVDKDTSKSRPPASFLSKCSLSPKLDEPSALPPAAPGAACNYREHPDRLCPSTSPAGRCSLDAAGFSQPGPQALRP